MGLYTCTLTVNKTGYYARWGGQEEDCAMSIDCGEEEWRRLHDIRLNGQVGQYTCTQAVHETGYYDRCWSMWAGASP